MSLDKTAGPVPTIAAVKHLYLAGVFMGLLLVITACQEVTGPIPNSGLYVARLQDCKPGYIPPRDAFGPGETPAVVLDNYSGLTVTLRVTDIVSGGIVWNNTLLIPRDRATNWWSLKVLPSGVYRAELLLGNTLRQSYDFNVTKAPAPQR